MKSEEEILENIKKEFENMTDYELANMMIDLAGAIDLSNICWYENVEDFYETMFADKVEVARAVYYSAGDYCFTDNYVRFDVYGNLETTDYPTKDYIDNIEEIIDNIIENFEYIKNEDILPKNIENLIIEYMKIEKIDY